MASTTRVQTTTRVLPDTAPPDAPGATLFHTFPVLTDAEIAKGAALWQGGYDASVYTDAAHNVVHFTVRRRYKTDTARLTPGLYRRVCQTAKDLSEAYVPGPILAEPQATPLPGVTRTHRQYKKRVYEPKSAYLSPDSPDAKMFGATSVHVFQVLTDKEIARGVRPSCGRYFVTVWTSADHRVVKHTCQNDYTKKPGLVRGGMFDRMVATARELSVAFAVRHAPAPPEPQPPTDTPPTENQPRRRRR